MTAMMCLALDNSLFFISQDHLTDNQFLGRNSPYASANIPLPSARYPLTSESFGSTRPCSALEKVPSSSVYIVWDQNRDLRKDGGERGKLPSTSIGLDTDPAVPSMIHREGMICNGPMGHLQLGQHKSFDKDIIYPPWQQHTHTIHAYVRAVLVYRDLSTYVMRCRKYNLLNTHHISTRFSLLDRQAWCASSHLDSRLATFDNLHLHLVQSVWKSSSHLQPGTLLVFMKED